MPDQQDLSLDPRAECASNVEKNDPHRSCLRLTCLRILCVHDGVQPDANFAGACEVSEPGIRDLLRLGEACQHGGKRDEEKELFHVHLQRFGWTRKRTRGARWCKMRNDWSISAGVGQATSPARVISGPPHVKPIEWSNL